MSLDELVNKNEATRLQEYIYDYVTQELEARTPKGIIEKLKAIKNGENECTIIRGTTFLFHEYIKYLKINDQEYNQRKLIGIPLNKLASEPETGISRDKSRVIIKARQYKQWYEKHYLKNY